MLKEIDVLEGIIKKAAGEELLSRFTTVSSEQKADGSLVTEADFAMQNRLQEELHQQWPDIVLLSEEMTPEQQQAVLNSEKPFWCLDPLDGTSNYAAGIPYFAVSLSLIEQGKVIVGLVYDPVRDECFTAHESGLARLNGKELTLKQTVSTLKQSIAIIDFKRLTEELAIRLVKDQPFASQRNFGASALDWCWMAASRGHIYLHGKQNIWDYSAGQFIFKMAGGHASTLEGEAIFVNKLMGRSVIAAESEGLLKQWLNWVRG